MKKLIFLIFLFLGTVMNPHIFSQKHAENHSRIVLKEVRILDCRLESILDSLLIEIEEEHIDSNSMQWEIHFYNHRVLKTSQLAIILYEGRQDNYILYDREISGYLFRNNIFYALRGNLGFELGILDYSTKSQKFLYPPPITDAMRKKKSAMPNPGGDLQWVYQVDSIGHYKRIGSNFKK